MAEIDQHQWNSLLKTSNRGVLHPAMRHEFLLALENTGCVTGDNGWNPLHIVIEHNASIVSCMPLYLKTHSYGEYVFDWAWAQAYERSGMRYFPKLLSAIPFTPVKAPKLLAKDTEAKLALIDGLSQLCNQTSQNPAALGTTISGAHLLFMEEGDRRVADNQWLSRNSVQFHWENINHATGSKFENFDDFLASLNKKKRKNINSERRKVTEAGVTVKRYLGEKITHELIAYFYACYANTYFEHHSTPYLNLAFFKALLHTMPENVMLAVATVNQEPVAASFFLYSEDRLYGRYWGCSRRIDCMHFEMCYYQGLEFAIEKGIQWFEGGAQGEHKMARGLNPTTMTSYHWIADARFREAIERFLSRETSHLEDYVSELQEHSAIKATETKLRID